VANKGLARYMFFGLQLQENNGPVHLAYNPSYSACFFSRNGPVHLAYNPSYSACFSAGL
jgi:hypothetical protein